MADFSKNINFLFCINYPLSSYFHFLSGYLMISLSCIWKCKLNKFYSLIKKLNILKQKDNHFAKFWKKSLHSWQQHSLVPSCCSVFHLTPSSTSIPSLYLPSSPCCAMLPDPLSDTANGIIPTPLTNARQWLAFADRIQLIVTSQVIVFYDHIVRGPPKLVILSGPKWSITRSLRPPPLIACPEPGRG